MEQSHSHSHSQSQSQSRSRSQSQSRSQLPPPKRGRQNSVRLLLLFGASILLGGGHSNHDIHTRSADAFSTGTTTRRRGASFHPTLRPQRNDNNINNNNNNNNININNSINNNNNNNNRCLSVLFSEGSNDPRSFSNLKNRSPPSVSAPEGFSTPEPKPLALAENADTNRLTRNALAFVLRLGVGAFCLGWRIEGVGLVGNTSDNDRYRLELGPIWIRDGTSVEFPKPPAQPLVLYEYDASPYCKRVREFLNLLDLTVEYRPCPGARQGGFSDELFAATGRRTVPYLYDPNTGEGLFESGDQIEYLLRHYGPTDPSAFDRKALWPITFEGFSVVTSALAALVTGMPGSRKRVNARPDNEQMLPLQLWGYESSPFVRCVRVLLGELCLPHTLVSCSRGSRNRDELVARTGRFQVPYLVDPNTGIELFECEDICRYLEEVYTVVPASL